MTQRISALALSRAFLRLGVWAIGLCTLAPASANDVEISGQARVIDGDTIEIAGAHIRIIGIDAPETEQNCSASDGPWNCGAQAGETLAQIIDGRMVTCHSSASDIYGRMLALCTAGSLDIGFAMVQGGMAIAARDASAEYHAAESRIKALKIGIWGSEFQSPADWRAEHPPKIARGPKAPTARTSPPANRPEQLFRNQFGCAIKGNHSRRGEWIYHLPGRPYYDETRPEELFCTESEALRAGYRRSKA